MILTGRYGRSFGSVLILAICFTSATVASSHCPKMVYLPFSMLACCPVNATSVMKNCELLVLGPALAYARRPGWSNSKSGETSFLNGATGSAPDPVPAGSPPWIMNCGITR